MKKYKLILAFTMCAILINSCVDENDLELVNPEQLSPVSFFKNEAQVQSAVNAAYASLQTRGLYIDQVWFMFDGLGQEWEGNSQNAPFQMAYRNFSFDSSHEGIGLYWDSLYRGINKANFVIGNKEVIDEIPEAFLSSTLKAKFIGEAKFLRAFYYFNLVTRFGDVPLITEIPSDATGFPRSPKNDVYNLIIADLIEASSTLFEKGAEDAGRATSGAAYALLGKTHLFMGNKTEALAAFNNVTGYDLEDNYYDNFKEDTEHGIESIFEVEFNPSLGAGSVWGTDGSGPTNASFRGQQYGHLGWFNTYPSDELLDVYEAGDSRYQDTFYSEGDSYSGGTMGPIPNERRAGWKKYQNYYQRTTENFESGINAKVIRYADVLLMQAECLYESDPTAAIGLINRVRSRPSVSLPAVSASLTGTALFNAIVHERQVEFAGEQIRFPDVVRWGNADTEFPGSNFQTGKHEVFPIPDSEISSNENISNDDQNAGY